MCLRIKEECDIKIARESIIVRKFITPKSRRKWKAYFRGNVFKYNKLLKAVRHLDIFTSFHKSQGEPEITDRFICKGFHSYLQDKNYCGPYFQDGVTPAYAIIPQGAEYCFGEYNDVVSNCIIVLDGIGIKSIVLSSWDKIEVKTADKPIIVWKKVDSEYKKRRKFKEFCRDETYKFNKLLRHKYPFLDIYPKEWGARKCTGNGFVVYKDEAPKYIKEFALRPAAIPRGARYVQGLNGEIMTEELIVFSSDKKLCSYLSRNRDAI